MKKYTLTGIAVAIVLGVAGVLFFISHKNINAPKAPEKENTGGGAVSKNPPPEKLPIINQTPLAPALLPPRTPPAGYREYRSEFYRFQFFYPSGLKVAEFKGADSSRTITFENTDTGEQFQLFIVPYGDPQISKARFKLDLPSGIIASSTTPTIGGVTAASFYSTDQILGKTHEVWFIGRGFLYEATTYQELDTWLDGMLQSWQFL